MAKSKYPNQLDTSVEIPTVHDNVTEIGSDVLNSFKSAILAIERTLGVNPQGSVGNTVSARIGRSLDSSGYLLPEALAQVGAISGPITNNEVSEVAAIKEKKLDLDFPTQLLQDEISMIQSDLNSISDNLADLSTKFSIHIYPNSLNRHNAVSINVVEAIPQESDVASLSLAGDTLQGTLETIYNEHINYTGLNISSTNHSHRSDQIYFNRENVQDLIFQDSIQGAIEDLADISGVGLKNNTLNLNSNGLIRRGKISDSQQSSARSSILVEESSILYTISQGSSKTTIIFSDTPSPIEDIIEYDILRLYGSLSDEDNKEYQISKITLSGANLVSIEVFGVPTLAATSGLTAEIYKNPFRTYNLAGLIGAARPRNVKTNTPDVQLANPNSAVIISSQITPQAITSSNHKFNITIDDGSPITIETYDSTVSEQTLDSIINKINEQAVDQRLNFLAYKYKSNNCFELALSHNIPNFSGDIKERTLTVDSGTTNDGATALGFSTLLGIKAKGSSGNSILLNGEIKTLFGRIKVFSYSDIEIISGTKNVSLVTDTFVNLGIRSGDILVVENAENSSDNGSYRINSILDSSAEMDTSYIFQDILNQNSVLYVLRVSAPITELDFSEAAPANSSIMFDIFVDDNLDVGYHKRMEIDGETRSGSFIASIIDVSRNFIIKDQVAQLNISTTGLCSLTDPNLNIGPSVYVINPGDYKIFSADGLSFVILRVGSTSTPSSSISVDLYGFNEIPSNNYTACRGIFSATLGRVIGYPSEPGVPALIDKRKTGTIDDQIISENILERYIQGPTNELLGSGVIRGMNVSNVQLIGSYQTFDVSAGIAFVNGIRREFIGKTDCRINTVNDFYIAIDEYGCIIAEEAITYPDGYTADGDSTVSPFYGRDVVHLAFSESQSVTDLRLFIDKLNYKITKDIIVSSDQNLGHFITINDAVKYAKRFSEIFPQAGTPNLYIREGLYLVSSPIIIDFDLTIQGAGRGTIIRKTGSLATGSALIGGEPDPLKTVFYIGNTASNDSSEIEFGVSIKDLVYISEESATGVGSFINLAEYRGSESTNPRLFRFENIVFKGPDNISFTSEIGEYFIVMGFADTTTFSPVAGSYGNTIITHCFYRRAGLEYGPCRLRDGAGISFRNVIATNNIGKILSPNENDTSFVVFDVPTTSIQTDFIEIGNITD